MCGDVRGKGSQKKESPRTLPRTRRQLRGPLEMGKRLLTKEIGFFERHDFRTGWPIGFFFLTLGSLRGFIALFLGSRHFLLSFLERGA
jgi:hypothetical protein